MIVMRTSRKFILPDLDHYFNVIRHVVELENTGKQRCVSACRKRLLNNMANGQEANRVFDNYE